MRLIDTANFYMGIGWKNHCGAFCVAWGNWTLHLCVQKGEDRFWGKREDWYDGPLYYYGAGPFALVTKVG